MKLHRIDHIGIVVNDLSAAKEFFLDFGFILKGEVPVEGEWVGRIIGLKDVKADIVMLQMPDSQLNLELTKFHTPRDSKNIQLLPANALGIRHISFVVDDIEAVVAKLKRKGIETVGDIQNYENTYKLCYVRGPEGIILELAEHIKNKIKMTEKTKEEQFVDDMEELFRFLDEINLHGPNRDRLIFLIGKAQGDLLKFMIYGNKEGSP